MRGWIDFTCMPARASRCDEPLFLPLSLPITHTYVSYIVPLSLTTPAWRHRLLTPTPVSRGCPSLRSSASLGAALPSALLFAP